MIKHHEDWAMYSEGNHYILSLGDGQPLVWISVLRQGRILFLLDYRRKNPDNVKNISEKDAMWLIRLSKEEVLEQLESVYGVVAEVGGVYHD